MPKKNSLKQSEDIQISKDKYYKDLPTFFEDIAGEPIIVGPFKQKAFLEEVQTLDGEWKILLHSGRGAGKSTTLAVVALWYAIIVSEVENEPMTILITAGSLKQSERVFKYIRKFCNKHEWIKKLVAGGKGWGGQQKFLQDYIEFKNGSYIEACPWSLTGIVGERANLLIIDEAAIPTTPTSSKLRITQEAVEEFLEPVVRGETHERIIIASTPYVFESYFVKCILDSSLGYSKKFNWSILDRVDKTDEWKQKYLTEAKQKGESYLKIQVYGEAFDLGTGSIKLEDLRKTLFSKKQLKKEQCLDEMDIVAGLDFGETLSDTALVIMGRVKMPDKKIQWTELFERSWTEPDLDKLIPAISYHLRDWQVDRIRVDASRPSHILALTKEWNKPIQRVAFQRKVGQMYYLSAELIRSRNVRLQEDPLEPPFDTNKTLVGQLRNWRGFKEPKKKDDLIDAFCLAVSDEQPGFKEESSAEMLETLKALKRSNITEVKQEKGFSELLTQDDMNELPEKLKGDLDEQILYPDPNPPFNGDERIMTRKEAIKLWKNYRSSLIIKRKHQIRGWKRRIW